MEEELRAGLAEAIRVLEDTAKEEDETDEALMYQRAIDLLNQRLDATYPGG